MAASFYVEEIIMAKKSRYMGYVNGLKALQEKKAKHSEVMAQKSVVGKLKSLKAEGSKA